MRTRRAENCVAKRQHARFADDAIGQHEAFGTSVIF
jgi:hypothetical protein